jgi:hypothetical protein
MSRFDTTGFNFLPMFLPAVLRFGRGGAGMSDPAPKLKLTQVDPVDELAPIPIAAARQRHDAFSEPFDSLRFAEETLEKVTLQFKRLRGLLEGDTPDNNGPDRAA